MATPDLTLARWRKSSRSDGNGGECVEVAHLPGTTAVRDSKNPDGPVLIFSQDALDGFLAGIKAGQFGR